MWFFDFFFPLLLIEHDQFFLEYNNICWNLPEKVTNKYLGGQERKKNLFKICN